MTEYITYTPLNATNITGVLRQSAVIVQQATGYDVFFPLILIVLFFGAVLTSVRFGFERAFTFSTFFTLICAFILTSAGLLDPLWVVVALIATGAALFMEG